MRARFLFVLLFLSIVPAAAFARTGDPDEGTGGQSNLAFGKWKCWDIGTADPCQHKVFAVDMLSADYGWATGGGVALQWDGSQWKPTPTGVSAVITDVSAVAIDDAWAAARDIATSESFLLHWNGSGWNKVPLAGDSVVEYLDMVASDDGWAVGSDIFRWDGASWSKFDDRSATALDFINANDGWIAISTPAGESLLHWNGSFLQEFDFPESSGYLSDIQMLASDDVWAVGDFSQAIHWDGSTWSKMPFPGSHEIRAFAMVSAADGWAFTDEWTYRWDGVSWQAHGPGGAYGAEMLSATDGWLGGDYGVLERWDGRYWGDRRPSLKVLTDVDAIASDDAWSVGQYGAIAHWDGTSWNLVDGPTEVELKSIDMLAASDGWAVGEKGVILRWNGSEWTEVASPTDVSLHSVSMLSAIDGWIVGGRGDNYESVTLHWNGSEWAMVASGTSNILNSVAAIAADDAWIVGDYGILLRWNGSSWNWVAAPDPLNYCSMHDLSFASASDGWAVGELGPSDCLWRWNGSEWTELDGAGGDAMFTVAAGDVWTVGPHGSTNHWDGSEWQSVPSPTIASLSGVSFSAAGDGWAVGGGAILHWDGNGWHSLLPPLDPPLGAELYDIEMVDADYGWAVGQTHATDETIIQTIVHWDGQQWSRALFEAGNALKSVDFLGRNDGWAVGGAGYALHWDGAHWQEVDTPTDYGFLEGVSMVTSDDVWVVGQKSDTNDPLIWHWTGSAWDEVTAPVSDLGLLAIDMLAAANGWAAGGMGTIIHWNGNEWLSVSSGTDSDLTDIDMLAADDGWALGSDIILRWNGSEWTEAPFPDRLSAYQDIEMRAPDDGWVLANDPGVGDVAVHWDGSTWESMPLPFWVVSIAAVSPAEAWAVGYAPILHYQAFVPTDFAHLPLVIK
jgi:hypothetical protein